MLVPSVATCSMSLIGAPASCVGLHPPSAHVVSTHLRPQAPQLFESLASSAHTPSHRFSHVGAPSPAPEPAALGVDARPAAPALPATLCIPALPAMLCIPVPAVGARGVGSAPDPCIGALLPAMSAAPAIPPVPAILVPLLLWAGAAVFTRP